MVRPSNMLPALSSRAIRAVKDKDRKNRELEDAAAAPKQCRELRVFGAIMVRGKYVEPPTEALC